MNLPPPTPKQARVIWFAITTFAVAVCMVLLAGLLWGLGRVLNLLAPVLWPLAVAAVIACVLDPVVDFLEHRKVPRTAGILFTFLAGLALLTVFFWILTPRLVDEAGQLLARVPVYTQHVQKKVSAWVAAPPKQIRWMFLRNELLSPPATNAVAPPVPPPASTNAPPLAPAEGTPETPEAWQQKIIESLTGWVTGLLPQTANWLRKGLVKLTSLLGIFVGLGLIPVYVFYFLHEKRGIQSKWTDYLPVQDSRFKDEVVFLLSAIQGYLVAFFRGQVLVATCDALLYTIGFLAIGLHYAFLLGMMAQVLTLIPFVGAMIICATSVVLAAVQFQDAFHPLLALGVFGVVQAVEGLVISPKIMGDRVGLHPLTILIAVMVGTTLLGGLLGGILAIPLTAVLRVVMFRYIWKKR
ncbi:MAG: AI-2E family transporter [Verrucomicrobia bacterium]|nr:AI-2E family transporter [Verrucomicrobiota bacterium]